MQRSNTQQLARSPSRSPSSLALPLALPLPLPLPLSTHQQQHQHQQQQQQQHLNQLHHHQLTQLNQHHNHHNQHQQPDQLFYYSPAPAFSPNLNHKLNLNPTNSNPNNNPITNLKPKPNSNPNPNSNSNSKPCSTPSPSPALFASSSQSSSSSSPAPDPLTTLSRDLIHYSLAHAAPNITALAPFGAPPLFNNHPPNLKPIQFNLANNRLIPVSSPKNPPPAIPPSASFNYHHLSQNQPYDRTSAHLLKPQSSLSIIQPQDSYPASFSPPNRSAPGLQAASSIRPASPKLAPTSSANPSLTPDRDQDRDRDRDRGGEWEWERHQDRDQERGQERDRGREQHLHLHQHQLPSNSALKLTSQPLYSPTHTVFDQHSSYSLDHSPQPRHFSALSLRNIPLDHNQNHGLPYPTQFPSNQPTPLPKRLRRKSVAAAPLSSSVPSHPNPNPHPNPNQRQSQNQNPNPNPIKSRSRPTQSKPASPSGLRLPGQPSSTHLPPLSPDQVSLPASTYSPPTGLSAAGFAQPSIKPSPMPLDSHRASPHHHPDQAPPKRPRGRSMAPERPSDQLGILSPDHPRLGYFDLHPAALSGPPNPLIHSPRLPHSPPSGPPPTHPARSTVDTHLHGHQSTSLLPDLDRTYRAFRTALGHANRQAALDAKDALASLLDRSALLLTQPTPQLAQPQTTLLPLDTPAIGYPTPASFLGLPTATSVTEPGPAPPLVVPPGAPRLERKRSRERAQTDALGQKAARPDEAGHSSAGLVSRRASLVGLSAALGPPAEPTPDSGALGPLTTTGLMSPSSATELAPATPVGYVSGGAFGAFGDQPQGLQTHAGAQPAQGFVSFPTPLMTPHELGGEAGRRGKLIGPAPTSSLSSPTGGERKPGDEPGRAGEKGGEAGECEGTFEWPERDQQGYLAMHAGQPFESSPRRPGGCAEDERPKAEEEAGWAADGPSQQRSGTGTLETVVRTGASLGDGGCEGATDTSHQHRKASIEMSSCSATTGQTSYQQHPPPPTPHHHQQVPRVASPPVNKQMGAASAGVSEELAAQFEPIFTNWLGRLCSDLDMKDSKGEPIHQTLMARKMQRLEESADFRPFKFRIQAFTNSFFEELVRCGFSEKELPMKKVRQYLWSQSCISRFNEEGKKAKSKGNHVWHIEAQKIMNGQWNFLHFQRKIIGTPPGEAYLGVKWAWAAKVWDPQCSAQNIKAVFSSADLPCWLNWKDNVLSGVPGPEELGREFEIVAVATTSHNSRRYSLELPFKISVRPREELDQILKDRQAEEASSTSQLESMAASMSDAHGGLLSSSEQPSTDSTPKLSPNLSGFVAGSGAGLEGLSAGLVGPGGRFGAQDGFPGLARTDSNESVSISSPSLEDLPMQPPDQLLAESGLMSGFAAVMKESSLEYEQSSNAQAALNSATAAAVVDALGKLADVQLALNPTGQQSLLGGEGRPELGLMIPPNPIVGGLMSSAALGPDSGTATSTSGAAGPGTGTGTGGMNSGTSGVGMLGQMMSGSELMPGMNMVNNEVDAMELSNALGNASPELIAAAAVAAGCGGGTEAGLPTAAALLEEVVQIQEAQHAVAMHEARLQTVRENLMSADLGVSDTAGKMIRQAIESADPVERQFAADVLGPMATGGGGAGELGEGGQQCEQEVGISVGGLGGEQLIEADGALAAGEGRGPGVGVVGGMGTDGGPGQGYTRRQSNPGPSIDHHHHPHHHHHHQVVHQYHVDGITNTTTGGGGGGVLGSNGHAHASVVGSSSGGGGSGGGIG